MIEELNFQSDLLDKVLTSHSGQAWNYIHLENPNNQHESTLLYSLSLWKKHRIS